MNLALEAALVSAILSDNYAKIIYNNGNRLPYLQTVETISKWAMEYADKYKAVNWQEVLENGHPDFVGCICWDDTVIEFGSRKMAEEGFNQHPVYSQEVDEIANICMVMAILKHGSSSELGFWGQAGEWLEKAKSFYDQTHLIDFEDVYCAPADQPHTQFPHCKSYEECIEYWLNKN